MLMTGAGWSKLGDGSRWQSQSAGRPASASPASAAHRGSSRSRMPGTAADPPLTAGATSGASGCCVAAGPANTERMLVRNTFRIEDVRPCPCSAPVCVLGACSCLRNLSTQHTACCNACCSARRAASRLHLPVHKPCYGCALVDQFNCKLACSSWRQSCWSTSPST